MATPLRPPVRERALALAIATLQAVDFVLHAATNQLEPIRVTANLIVLLWLALIAAGRLTALRRPAAVTAIGAYVILNGLFLAQAGLTNPAQGGALRVTLLVLVVLTTGLALWLAAWPARER